MRKTNLYFGVILFIIFLGTGYYMNKYFTMQNWDNLIVRMQIRSNHIYILFIALLNFAAFKVSLNTDHQWSKYLDALFRILLIISGIVSLLAFYHDHDGDLANRTYSFFAVVLSLSSVVIAALSEIIRLKMKSNP